MARAVQMVPNPWLPYMDGLIWEFTEDEVREMGDYQPMMNRDGEMVGMRCMRWYHRGKFYVRFYDPDAPGANDPAVLAGWKDPS